MNVNTSLVTNTGRNVTEVSVDAYRDTIAAHQDNDYSGHTSMQLHLSAYTEPVSGHIVADATLRMLLTDAGGSFTDAAWALPALVQPGTFPPSGSAPTILRQPQAISVVIGNTARFDVYMASATAAFYQWRKNGTNINGANSAEYVILNVQSSDAGTYSVVITNSVGTATSAGAVLTVTAS